MHTVLITLHIILAVVLITLVLLQQGKGADVGAVISGGGANSLFGVSGASNLLVKMTTIVAVLFMATSIGLFSYSARYGGGINPQRDILEGSVVEGLVPEKKEVAAMPAENTPLAQVATPIQTPS